MLCKEKRLTGDFIAETDRPSSDEQESAAASTAASANGSSKRHNRSTKSIFLKKSGIEEAKASGWIRAFTRLHKVPVFRRVWIYLFVMTLYTMLVDHFLDKNLMANLAKQSGTVAFSS